jgi:hypothetical protein
MTKPIARDAIYRKRVFDADIIELGTVSFGGVSRLISVGSAAHDPAIAPRHPTVSNGSGNK